ncbi:ABC transporter permease [Dactylosporangium fulvum]|uniref:ABC transporter permease n=1 Tax=Dactylosporangium fulvum TaxID=53359 RepID=A0ABY5W758_9ACTN|nr:ABC transporter permease [Dactylosporangium fulvum]UWP85215.1 ABC transporter permease [Dactylosporangium fulvum]
MAARQTRRLPVTVVMATLVVLVVTAAAVMPHLFTGHDPNATDPLASFRPPGADHLFGTDQLGRDLFARAVHGARHSLRIAAGATLVALLVAVPVGVLAALGGRLADLVVSRVLDVLLSFPALLLALVVVTIVGRGELSLLVAIGLADMPGYARLLRSRLLVVRHAGYVEAATGLGVGPWTSLWRHILPNAVGPLLVMATLGFGVAVIFASGLSFLGLGTQPPTPEWGAMLAEGRSTLAVAWWAGVFPGLLITVTAVAVTILGRALRTRFGVGAVRGGR